jgi:hypothetical protein
MQRENRRNPVVIDEILVTPLLVAAVVVGGG